MHKTDFVAAVAAKTQGTQTEAALYLNAIVDTLREVFQKSDTLTLSGFGTFGVKTRAGRLVHHPVTGKEIDVPAKQVPFVRISSKIKALLNGSSKDKMKQNTKNA